MITVAIDAVPNQSLSVQVAGNTYDLRFKSCGNFMAVDISINNTPVVIGFRGVPGTPILPYRYLENGNFVLLTGNDNQDYPDWQRFGIDQFLVFASQTELNEIRFLNIVGGAYA